MSVSLRMTDLHARELARRVLGRAAHTLTWPELVHDLVRVHDTLMLELEKAERVRRRRARITAPV